MKFDVNELSYGQLIGSRFCTVLSSSSMGEYEGDEFYIVEQANERWGDGVRYGFVSVGYGSCSGCDDLQGADDANEVNELAERIYKSIKWFATLDELKAHLDVMDAANEWYMNDDDWPQAKAELIAGLDTEETP
jgi:hypothetical protein